MLQFGLGKQKEKVQSELINIVFSLPEKLQPKPNFALIQEKVSQVCAALVAQTKKDITEIERVCRGSSRLAVEARLLREHIRGQEEVGLLMEAARGQEEGKNGREGKPEEDAKPVRFFISAEDVEQREFSKLLFYIINMFTLMMTSHKMIEFFNKLNIPFSIYRIVLRMYCNYDIFTFLKKAQVVQSLKFIGKMLSVRTKNFPRLYASLVMNIINQFCEKSTSAYSSQDLIINRQSQILQGIKITYSIALDLIKVNLRLAAQSGVLVTMYTRAIEGEIVTPVVVQLVEVITQHMNTPESREIVLGNVDLARVFALFTNVDYCCTGGRKQEKIERCALVIEMLLSSTSTLFYLLSQRLTLKNFLLSLRSKSKSESELEIINQKIFRRLIDKALRYDRNKMERSNNLLGLYSNCLNYRALLTLSYFLDSTHIIEFYLKYDPSGNLFAGLGKVSLMYFSATFEKGKYNKQVIQSIKLPSANDYEKIDRNFLNILSYYDYCIIPYEFAKRELINYLIELKSLQVITQSKQQSTQSNIQAIQGLLDRAKKPHAQNFDLLLLDFYKTTIKVCEMLPWKPQHLKIAKFLSAIIEYLHIRYKSDIMNACMAVVEQIFNAPKPNYYCYLYITALEDAARFFQDHTRVEDLIVRNYQDQAYAFRISRILLHMDLNKKQLENIPVKLLKKICYEGGSEELILQVVEIIRFYCMQNEDKASWGTEIICEKLIYHESEEIACAAVEFCQEFISNHKTHKNLLYNKINLANIKDSNLRKRMMYLLLSTDKGLEVLNSYNPNFIRLQIDEWLKEGPSFIRDLSIFMSKQVKKFNSNKQASFLDLGKATENRHKLTYLPWNVVINQKHYIALASYKYLKQKIKLRISPQLLVQTRIQVEIFRIGAFTMAPSEKKTIISIQKEQVIKSLEKTVERKDARKFVISKEKASFLFKYEAGSLFLERLLIDIPLARDVYRSLIYPLNFLSLLIMTNKGFGYLKEKNFIDQCIKMCKIKQDKQDKQKKDYEVQLLKGAILSLGILFSSWRLEYAYKTDIFLAIKDVFQSTTHLQIKEVALWGLNIIVKDEDFRRKLKENKGWLVIESKYCGWLCFPHFANQQQFKPQQICRFKHIPDLFPERLLDDKGKKLYPEVLPEGYRIIVAALNEGYKDFDRQRGSTAYNHMITYFKKPITQISSLNKSQNRNAWNAKLLDVVVLYISAIDFSLRKIKDVLDVFTQYYLSDEFDKEVLLGTILP